MNPFSFFALLHSMKSILAQGARRQQDVLLVCSVYPHKVSVSDMDHALYALQLDPGWVYRRLCEGSHLPDVDEELGVVS